MVYTRRLGGEETVVSSSRALWSVEDLGIRMPKTSASVSKGGKTAPISKASGKAVVISKLRGKAATTPKTLKTGGKFEATAKPGSTLAKIISGEVDPEEVIPSFAERQRHIDSFMEKCAAPTPIPGWSFMDICGGTKGCQWGGHSIYDMSNPKLKDRKLHARCQAWMPLSLADLKALCKEHKLGLEGSKKVLALRLAIRAPQLKP